MKHPSRLAAEPNKRVRHPKRKTPQVKPPPLNMAYERAVAALHGVTPIRPYKKDGRE
jgi:hypothetical protein